MNRGQSVLRWNAYGSPFICNSQAPKGHQAYVGLSGQQSRPTDLRSGAQILHPHARKADCIAG